MIARIVATVLLVILLACWTVLEFFIERVSVKCAHALIRTLLACFVLLMSAVAVIQLEEP